MRVRAARDEHLPDHRLDFLGALATGPQLSVGTSRQPSSIWPSPAIARSISCSHAMRDAGSLRQEHHADAVLAERRQREALPAAGAAQERVGELDQDAGAVALQRVGAGRAAVRQVLEDLTGPA